MDLAKYTLVKGGNWLVSMRGWLLNNIPHAYNLTWGSDDQVTLTVKQLEEMCAEAIAGDRIIRESAIEQNYDDLKKACFGLLNLDPNNSTLQKVQEREIYVLRDLRS
jgi:hypothetical protein